MDANRILGEGKSFYHAITRTNGRFFAFKEAKEKEVCRKIMRKLETVLSVRVVTYCFMSNHLHILLEVPDKSELEPLTKDQLLELLPVLYDETYCLNVKQEFERAEAHAEESARKAFTEVVLARFEARRADLSVFMKEFKHRITKYINKEQDRVGTLWESRFKSVLVEGNEGALLAMAAYIDLNPVRAGMVEKPEDYRWCGYAEAVAGSKVARQGLGTILSEAFIDESYKADWRRTHNRYRLFLYTEGEEKEAEPEKGKQARKGFSRQEVEQVEGKQGAMSIPQVLRHRVRYFCDGAVFGTAEFVDGVFERHRSRFGPKRETGARRMRGAKWGDLRVLRDLQTDVVGD